MKDTGPLFLDLKVSGRKQGKMKLFDKGLVAFTWFSSHHVRSCLMKESVFKGKFIGFVVKYPRLKDRGDIFQRIQRPFHPGNS